MKLYGHFRSSADYRVRIALGLKGLAYERVVVRLRAGDQSRPEYVALNPERLVPTLIDGEVVLTQSLAIIEYLEERHPKPPLLPADLVERARVRGLALAIACDVHPLNNLRVLNYLTGELGLGEEKKLAWYHHWIAHSFEGLEAQLEKSRFTGTYCHGETPTLADVCLVPQLANARRYECDLGPYPTLVRIEGTCLALPAFDRARPEVQPDRE